MEVSNAPSPAESPAPVIDAVGRMVREASDMAPDEILTSEEEKEAKEFAIRECKGAVRTYEKDLREIERKLKELERQREYVVRMLEEERHILSVLLGEGSEGS